MISHIFRVISDNQSLCWGLYMMSSHLLEKVCDNQPCFECYVLNSHFLRLHVMISHFLEQVCGDQLPSDG